MALPGKLLEATTWWLEPERHHGVKVMIRDELARFATDLAYVWEYREQAEYPAVSGPGLRLRGFITISLIEVQVIREIAITASLGAAIILTNLALLPVLLPYFEADEEQRRAARVRDALMRPMWSWVA